MTEDDKKRALKINFKALRYKLQAGNSVFLSLLFLCTLLFHFFIISNCA